MASNQTDRPNFYEQQYLGSADLDALVDYERLARARHDLGAHSWGIASGLQLIEKPTKTGVDLYVQPGYAWDGFGRPLLVPAPYKLPADAFKDIAFTAGVDDGSPAGHLVDVWLAFTATPRGGPASGFESCTTDAQYARIFETFRIVVGDKPGHADRHAPVTVGAYTVDAEQMPRKLGAATDPPLVDESIAYQTFPANWDQALWLVPLGSVRWLPPQNVLDAGNFVARVAADLAASDHKRRYIGVVAETLDAARGFVRVRSRDAAAYAPTIWNTDAEKSLLWVEGALRVEGDARLLGGQLVLRDPANNDSGRPLTIRRREVNEMVPAGSDVWVQVGSAQAGANRFVVGPVTGTTAADFKALLVVKDDGSVGIGTPDPGGAPLTVRAAGATQALVAFETPAGAPSWTLSTLAGGKPGLNFGEPGGDGRLFLQPGGNVGVGTLDPKHRLEIHGEDNAVVIVSDATTGTGRNVGLELRTAAADGTSYIDFTRGSTDLAGSGTPDFSGRLSFNETGTGAFSMRGGRLGIEIAEPTNRLHVNHNSGLRVNRLSLSGGLGGIDRWSSLSFNAQHDDGNNTWVFPDPTQHAVTLEMDNAWGDPRFEVFSTTTANKTGWIRRLSINGDNGNVVMNDNGGTCAVGIVAAECKLHVAGSTDGADGLVGSHVAVIDNRSGGLNSDVLALRIGPGAANPFNNFVTFFAGASDIGAIEGNGIGVSYQTTSADYAEWIERDANEAPMRPGDVVGVFGGRLRRATDGADHVLVVSTTPSVLGNRPAAADRVRFEKAAMLGQVPVRVRGAVSLGDLIVPSGDEDGTGLAVPAAQATPEQCVNAVGVAWQASRAAATSLVRCAVGLVPARAWRNAFATLERAPMAAATAPPAAARKTPAAKRARAEKVPEPQPRTRTR